MAEEHRCQAPRLCVNNCGFFGIPATQGLCSKCYRDLQLQQRQQSSSKHALHQSLTATVEAATATTTTTTNNNNAPSSLSNLSSDSPPAVDSVDPQTNQTVVADQFNGKKEEEAKAREEAGAVVQGTACQEQQRQQTNRCLTCRKRVGLTGFKCRCGLTFCGTHRYPENHGCTFDFKSLGKEQIAKENPIVKAEKLVEKI